MPTLIVSVIAFVAFVSGIAVQSGILAPPPDPLAPIPGWETRYVLVGGDSPRTIKRGEYEDFLSLCTNSATATTAVITPGYPKIRIFQCDN